MERPPRPDALGFGSRQEGGTTRMAVAIFRAGNRACRIAVAVSAGLMLGVGSASAQSAGGGAAGQPAVPVQSEPPAAAHEQPSPAERAQEAIGIYAAVLAISSVCTLPIAPAARIVVDRNVEILAGKAGLSAEEIGRIMTHGVAQASPRKADLCRMDLAGFERFEASQFVAASEAAVAAGIAIAEIPGVPPVATEPPPVLLPPLPQGFEPEAMLPPSSEAAAEPARERLVWSHLIEAVADECEIDLNDQETAGIEQAQSAARTRSGLAEAQINGMVERLEQEVEKGRRFFCSPRFNFREALKALLTSKF